MTEDEIKAYYQQFADLLKGKTVNEINQVIYFISNSIIAKCVAP